MRYQKSANKLLYFMALMAVTGLIISVPHGFAQGPLDSEDPQTAGTTGLEMVPAIIDQPIVPGKPTEFSVRVTNITDRPLAVEIGARPPADILQQVDEQLQHRYNAASWVEASAPKATIDAGKELEINFKVNPPADAGPGGHYTQVFVRAINGVQPKSGSSTSIHPEISALLMMSVPGEVNEKLESSLQAPALLSLSLPKTLQLKLTNSGNIHLIPSGQIDIMRGGALIESLSLRSSLLLPGTSSAQTLNWDPKGPGIYAGAANVSFGTPLQRSTDESSKFVVLPAWWVIISVVLGLIALGLWLGQWLKRKFFKKTIRLSSD